MIRELGAIIKTIKRESIKENGNVYGVEMEKVNEKIGGGVGRNQADSFHLFFFFHFIFPFSFMARFRSVHACIFMRAPRATLGQQRTWGEGDLLALCLFYDRL